MPPPSMRGPGTDRERWSTIVDAPQEPRHHTAEFGRIPTANIPARWREAFEEVARTLALAKKKGGSAAERAAKAEPLVEHARELLQRVERNAERVAKEQALVDSIEERGREARARLGFAIDELGRDRARVRAHADEVNLVRRESARPPLRFDPRAAEVQVWQDAALSVEEEAMLKGERDLSFQIDTLTTRLETETEIIARELTEPAARLEGGLSAIRSITTELVRVLDDAISILSPGRRR